MTYLIVVHHQVCSMLLVVEVVKKEELCMRHPAIVLTRIQC
jgi:hypothetical protein